MDRKQIVVAAIVVMAVVVASGIYFKPGKTGEIVIPPSVQPSR